MFASAKGTVSGTAYSYPILPFGFAAFTFFPTTFLKIAVYAYLTDTYVPRFERLKRSILLYCGSSDFLGLVFFACIFSFFLVE